MSKDKVITLLGQKSITAMTKDALGGYEMTVSKAPRPYSTCKEYNLHFSPTEGLLAVNCVGASEDDNGNWDHLRSVFDSVKKDLEAAYLLPETENTNGPTPYRDNQSIMLMAQWSDSQGGSVLLFGMAKGDGTGQIIISYLFEGWPRYIAEVQGKDSTL